jgi:hypothetical protein
MYSWCRLFDFKAWLRSQTGESGKPGDNKNAQQLQGREHGRN